MKLLQRIIKINKIQIIGIVRGTEKDAYYFLQTKRKGSKIDFSSPEIANNIDDLFSKLNKAKPVILVIDGKAVITKKISEKLEVDIAWKRNLDLNSIYFTEIRQNDFTYLSICRRSTVDEYISLLKNNGLQLVDFYLGPLTAVFLYPVLNEEVVYANASVLEFKDDVLENITKGSLTSKEYQVAGQGLLNFHIPLYGAAIDYHVNFRELSKAVPIGFNLEEIIYKKGFELFGKIMLVFYFVTLLVSYVATGYYSSENINLNQQSIYSGQTIKQISELQEKKAQKLLLLNQASYLSKQFLNFYTYELVRSIPSTIEINKLEIFPLIQEVRENKKIEMHADIINCKGITASETVFNQWLNILKKMKWIKKFEIVSLEKDKKNFQHFELKIAI